MEIGLWKNFLYMHSLEQSWEQELMFKSENDVQNMFQFYDSLYGFWVKVGVGDKWVKQKQSDGHPQGCLVGKYKPFCKKN